MIFTHRGEFLLDALHHQQQAAVARRPAVRESGRGRV